MAEKRSLPSIKQLASDAWELFKKTWVVYFKLVGLAIAWMFLIFLIGILIILPIVFAGVFNVQFFSQLTLFTIAMLILFILWFVFLIVSLIAIEISFPIAGVFILQGKKASPIFDLLKTTKPFFWTFFLTVLLSSFLIVGAMHLLLIPGLLIAFFLSFSFYEVVIDGQKVKAALKRSYFMIKNNFWEVLGRLIVLEIAYIIATSILGRLAKGDGLAQLVYAIFVLFSVWYAQAYMFLLYKAVRAHTTFPEKISIKWIWIVSVIGWVFFLFLLIAGIFAIMHEPVHPIYTHHVSPNAV